MKNLLILVLLLGTIAYSVYAIYSNRDGQPASPVPMAAANLAPPSGQPCAKCNATGKIACTSPECQKGRIECPGPCLKLSTPGWGPFPGEDPKKLFITYKVKNGTQGVSQAHLGEVFEVRNGEFFKLGRCTLCNGTTKVRCATCEGSGEVTCPECSGKKFVALSASAPSEGR